MPRPESLPARDVLPARGLPRNVWVLSWVSLFNDSATEMSYWLLPQFLVSVLGAGPAAFGLIEGAAETVASFGRLLSGVLSDRWRRRKPLLAAGYTVANVVKPLLAVAQSWGQVFWIRFADRAAKGFRAAPRDALLADSVAPGQHGAAFGLRQAMDSAGAIAGPLAALTLLPVFGGKVRWIFALAALPGMASILLAWGAVREVRPASPVAGWRSRPGGEAALTSRRLRILLLAVGFFALGNSSDLFLILRAQNLGVRAAFAPLLGLIFNFVYTILSWPAGKLSDRLPKRYLVMLGYLIYAGVYAAFALARGPQAAWFLFAVYGIYYALTEGVLKAWVADLVPSAERGRVFGVFNWVIGVMAFPASVLAGWLWQRYTPSAPFFLSSGLALGAAILLLFA